MGSLSSETVGALLPSPPLCRWVRGWVARVVVYGCCMGLFGLHIWVLRFLIVYTVCFLLGYLEGEIFFFQLVASFLVELEATMMVVVL